MNTAVAIANPTRADVFVGRVLPPERMQQVLGSLPAHVKPERFERNLVIAVTQHPRLLDCDPVAVFNEVSKAAALGLYLDPQLGEAYLITGFSNGRQSPQLRLGYRGLIKLARQSGGIASVYAHEVCQGDKFKMSLGTEKRIEHEPDFKTDRGEVGLYYAVVRYADGETDFEPMSLKEVHRIRDRSDGWRAFKAGKIKSTPWGTDEGEMAKKTVLRRLLKRLPQSPEIADALRIDDDDYRDADVAAPRETLSTRLAIAGRADTGFSADHVQIETARANVPLAEGDGDDQQSNSSQDASPPETTPESGSDASAPATPLPEGWETTYVSALKRAQKVNSLKKLAAAYWEQYGGWPMHAKTENGKTASAIFSVFNDHFDNKDVIAAQLRELIG